MVSYSDWMNISIKFIEKLIVDKGDVVVSNFILFAGTDWNIPTALIGNIPTLAYTKRRHSDIISMPWTEQYSGKYIINKYIEARKHRNYPWEAKANTIVWRGMPWSPNLAHSGLSLELLPRYHVSVMSHHLKKSQPHNISWLDACLVGSYNWYIDTLFHNQTICASDSLGKIITLRVDTMLKYRYILNIGGTSGTSNSILWKLSSSSLVLNVESDYEDWYDPLLKPWIHYVPIRKDLSDLKKQYDYLNNNTDLAKKIITNANKMIDMIMSHNYIRRVFLEKLSNARIIGSRGEICKQ